MKPPFRNLSNSSKTRELPKAPHGKTSLLRTTTFYVGLVQLFMCVSYTSNITNPGLLAICHLSMTFLFEMAFIITFWYLATNLKTYHNQVTALPAFYVVEQVSQSPVQTGLLGETVRTTSVYEPRPRKCSQVRMRRALFRSSFSYTCNILYVLLST